MIDLDINIDFTNYRGKAEGELWVNTFIDNVILPKLKFTDTTIKEMGETVKEQQEYNLFHSLDFKGGAVQKKKSPSKYGGMKTFLNTGELYRSVMMKLTGISEAEIFISANRSQIAYWLATGTRYMPSRPFFGVSEELKTKLNKIYFKQLNKNG